MPEYLDRLAFVAKKQSNRGLWLFKEDPDCYSFEQLEKDGSTVWSGVKNALARMNLRKIQPGDRVLYYVTGQTRAIVGEMQAVTEPAVDPGADDPKSVIVTVKPIKRWNPPVTLAEIKEDPAFADWDLLRISRLSVMPVSPKLWRQLEEICLKNQSSRKGA